MQSPPMIKLLGSNAWLLSLPEEARKELLAASILKKVPADHVLFRKGDSSADLFGVLSGRIKIGATTYSGEELLINTKIPGEWFGELAILDGKERSHGAVTLEASELAIVPEAAIMRLRQTNRDINDALVGLLCHHCRQAFSAIDDFLILTPEQRLASRLIKLIEDRKPPIALKLNQQELSDLVGVSRQSMNKILKKWEQEEYISRGYNLIEVLSVEQIQALIE